MAAKDILEKAVQRQINLRDYSEGVVRRHAFALSVYSFEAFNDTQASLKTLKYVVSAWCVFG